MARVLVVDDEASLLMTLAANLELEGFEVVEARNGPEALRAIQEGPPVDLVLSDIRMPGMHGVDLFRAVKQKSPGTPVILMTAFAMESLVQEALREGAFAVLPKPFSIEHVIATLGRAAKRPLVLVVDDAERDARSTAEALVASGLRATVATDAGVALEAIRDGAIDVCVIDLVMPGVDGAELLERIKALDPTIGSIAVSGYPVPQLMTKVAAAGAAACMRKPFDIGELIDAIARVRAAPTRAR